ncbi:MAG: NAD-dependent succinate-semialdehyde dehydrogenase [Geopsychrobacter sp.]|nr:NAD-dependent succinate-semialdehyde dehydrogenase [Geopsychrobacter sp.]
MALQSLNPATGELLETYPEWPVEQTMQVLDEVTAAWRQWKNTSFEDRAVYLRKAAQILRERSEDYARLMALEMGKPITGGIAEVNKCADVCEFYAEHAAEMLADEPLQSDASQTLVSFQPIGTVLAVMPWNFPFWQVFRFAAPALMAGNTGVLKHASNVPQCAMAIEQVFIDAGLPANVFRTLMIGSGQVAGVIEHKGVAAVTLTGSDAAGRKVAGKAGEMLKKTVMELGGSDAYIVLEDADLDAAAQVGSLARCHNSGQSCIAAKRFIVVDAVYDAFLEKFTLAMQNLGFGDPLDATTDVGPQARPDLMAELHQQVCDTVAAGATLHLGGKPLDGPGCFYPPTILTGVKRGMVAYHQELFGPVATLIRVKDEDEAVAVANDSDFGLAGSVWSQNTARGLAVARKIETGGVFVNGMSKSDPRVPFGGIKISGYGRELSHYGIREFVNIKTLWVK